MLRDGERDTGTPSVLDLEQDITVSVVSPAIPQNRVRFSPTKKHLSPVHVKRGGIRAIRELWSIQTLIILLFTGGILLTGIIIWLIGFLTSRQGIVSISSVAENYLMGSVKDFTLSFLSQAPIAVQALHDNAVWLDTNGLQTLNISNPVPLRRLMYSIGKLNPSIANVYYGTYLGDFNAADKNAVAMYTRHEWGNITNYYNFDNTTMETLNLDRVGAFTTVTRFWFVRAKQYKTLGWTAPYIGIYGGADPFVLTVAASVPHLAADGTFLGAFGLNFQLPAISDYLKQQTKGQNREIYIMERNGLLIASSIGEVQLKTGNNLEDVFRVPAVNHSKVVVRESANYIIKAFNNDLTTVVGQQQLQFYDSTGDEKKIQVQILNDGLGIDWIAVTVVSNTQLLYTVTISTIISCCVSAAAALASVVIALAFGFCITRPIKSVSREMNLIANMDLTDTKNGSPALRLNEFRKMSDSMAQMKQGLKNFQKFVPGDVVREILRQNCGVQLGVTSRRLTILFIDLANFTTISESVAPATLIKLLSQFFTEMSQSVVTTSGTIDKFIGDAIMAFWNAPNDVPNHEICAVEAGLDMLARLEQLKKSVSEQVLHDVGVRIGIYTADSLIGNVGSPERITLGDGVNLASRLEGINKRYETQILVGDATYEVVKPFYACKWLDYIAVKGKEQPVDVYEIICRIEDASFEVQTLCENHLQMRDLLKLGDFTAVCHMCENELLGGKKNVAASLLLERLNSHPTIHCALNEK